MQRNHHQTLNEFLAARKGIFLGGAYTTIPFIMETTASNPCIMVKGSRKKVIVPFALNVSKLGHVAWIKRTLVLSVFKT